MNLLVMLHPPLIALALVLSVTIKNLHQAYLEQILFAGAIAVGAAATLTVVLVLMLGRPAKAALTASILTVVGFTYGVLYDRWLDDHHELSAYTLHALTAAQLGIAATVVLLLIWRVRFELTTAAVCVTAVTGTAVAYYTVQIGQRGLAFSPPERAVAERSVPALEESRPGLPDIYWLILDGYTREDVMRWVYGHDNSDFISGLRQRGFYVADRSYANYATTFMSLAATFDMDYLDDESKALVDTHGPATRSRGVFYDKIREPQVARFLQSLGYRYITTATNWPGTGDSPLADMVFRYPSVARDRFYNQLLASTALRTFAPSVADMHAFTLQSVRDSVAIDGPTFAFFHFLLPHNPYVVNREGEEILHLPLALNFKRETGGWRVKRPYVEQVIAVNRQMLSLIDYIVQKSPVPPIIILQGDHGSATIRRPPGPGQGKRKLPIAEERLSILNAMLVPERVRARLYPSISPINTFRLILAEQFGADLELLEDRHFFSWYNKPQFLIDESERLASITLNRQHFEAVLSEAARQRN